MPVFTDSQQLYSVLTELLREIESQYPSVIRDFQKSTMTVLFSLSDPDLRLVVGSSRDGLEVSRGDGNQRGKLTVEMPADLLDGILMGNQSVKEAISSGNLVVKGPFWKMIYVVKVFQYGKSVYSSIKQNYGLDGGYKSA